MAKRQKSGELNLTSLSVSLCIYSCILFSVELFTIIFNQNTDFFKKNVTNEKSYFIQNNTRNTCTGMSILCSGAPFMDM